MSKRQTNERGNKNVDKGVLSDNDDDPEEEPQQETPRNMSLRKESQKPSVNTRQEKGTSSTGDDAKKEKGDEKEESIKPIVSDFSNLGQWTGYLTTSILILLGILLYHVLYIQSLSTISEKNVQFIIEKMYGPKFEEMLKKEVDKCRTSHLNNLERDINTMNKTLKELEDKVRNIGGNVTEIQSQVKHLKARLGQVETDIEVAKESITAFQAEAIRAISGNVTQLKSSFEYLNESFKPLKESHSAISYKLEEANKTSNQLIIDQQKIKDKNEIQTQNYIALEHKITDCKNQLDETNKSLTNMTNSLAVADSRLKQNLHLTADVGSLKTAYTEKIEPNLFNKGYFSLAFMLLFMLVLITLISQYRLYQRMECANRVQEGRSRNHPNRFQSSIEILSQVPSKPQLQAAVCIISFDEGRQAAHQQLLDSANLPNCRVVTFVVRRHSNIPDLPRCKVYLMCTEFSERHVIIEEQGLGLGDLHRTTYDAVLKLGGQLIILYTRDPGSRRLKDNEVYNKGIYCVTHQEELVELNNLGRFFSVYDTLTTQQKTKLRQTIMDCLQ